MATAAARNRYLLAKSMSVGAASPARHRLNSWALGGIMAYCECGDVATRFYDDDGTELVEPCCDECWFFQLEKLEELFGNLIRLKNPPNKAINPTPDSGPLEQSSKSE